MAKGFEVVAVSDAALARTINIIGAGSAAAQALRERDRRRADGEEVHVFLRPGWGYIVGPMPDEERTGPTDTSLRPRIGSHRKARGVTSAAGIGKPAVGSGV